MGCSEPGTTGTPAAIMRRRASTLSPIASIASGEGPMNVSPASRTARANGGALGEEAVARVDGVGAGALGDVEELARICEIALGSGRRTDVEGLVGEPHVQRRAVGVGVDGDGLDAELAAGADDADRDLAAVGDQHTTNASHASSRGKRGSLV